jgi:hypothetical protein
VSQVAREQALLSEYKGNLFEFLVGSSLSRKLKIEMKFLSSLSEEFKKMLSIQESFIRQYYPELLIDLPVLASGIADEIINSIEFEQISDIAIVGKVALASQNSTFSEADIILKSKNKFYPISLKLSKANAFVNTKSAGLRSFFTKYFSSFGDETVNSIQDSFNQNCDLIINNFANALYANHDLEYDGSFAQWVDLGNTSLSGQLEGADRELYKHMLYAINEKVYIHVNQLLVKDPKAFSMDLLPLMGFGDRQIIQATCFYKANAKNYAAFENVVEVYDSGFEKLEPKLGSFKMDVANFDICLGKKTLQLRVKAMNKFTSKSFKMNCSVKTS